MKRSAAVAIVGGGVIGASVAYHLARRGVKDVVIVDGARGPGEGSTGRATGGYRAQFATAVNVRLSLYARGELLAFREVTGVDPGYSPVGYLWIAHDDRQLEGLRSARAVQHACGLTEAVEVSRDDLAVLNPAVSGVDVVGGVFCQSDGYIRPLDILRGYLAAAERLGVTATWGTRCTGFTRDGDRITHVETSGGPVAVEAVVNAAGPWASSVAEMAGVHLPVRPVARHAAITVPTSAIPSTMPMTIFVDNGFHVRARDGKALICWPRTDAAPVAADSAPAKWIEAVDELKRERFPALRDVEIDRSACYTGLYEMSPDSHAIVGFSGECTNMFLVNGSSGHGVMHSPSLGAAAAAMIAGDAPPVDVRELRPSRFREGRPVTTSELL